MRVLVLGGWSRFLELILYHYPGAQLISNCQKTQSLHEIYLCQGAYSVFTDREKTTFDHIIVFKGMLHYPILREFGLELKPAPFLYDCATKTYSSWLKWTPQSHQYHRPKTKKRIFQVLLGSYDHNSPLSLLDRHCLIKILCYVN